MNTIQPLSYAELVAPERTHERILCPGEIPIHPKVYNSPLVYTPEFIMEVRAQMPDALRKDISEIKRILQEPLGFTITNEGILDVNPKRKFHEEPQKFNDIKFEVDQSKKTLWGGIYASTIGILSSRDSEFSISQKPPIGWPSFSHPLPKEKAEQYCFRHERSSFGQDQGYYVCHTWYNHNLHDQGKLLFHYLRTFAIVFNNLGLAKLEASPEEKKL